MVSGLSVHRIEVALLAVFFAWLAWVPLPFGSVVEAARPLLIAVPLGLCCVAAAVRLVGTSERNSTAHPTRAWLLWGSGAALLTLLGLVQVMPTPEGVVRYVSPEAHAIWSAARRIAGLGGVPAPSWRLSVDPAATGAEVLRLAGIFAAFTTATVLVRSHSRRLVMAFVLCAAGVFESMYGLREAALQRYEIWGWVNRLIFDRVTGTFVNPNHFAHYLAILLPLPLFVIAVDWHYAAPPRTPLVQRFLAVFNRSPLRSGMALLAAVTMAAGMLLAQSRGALLALATGLLAGVAISPGSRGKRIAGATGAGAVLLVSLVLFLGPERTVGRFLPAGNETETMVGRKHGIGSAFAVWQRFPIAGSGLGTFARVVSMEQRGDPEKIFHHAHNDYMEILTTGGIAGAAIALVSLVAGWIALWRMTAGKESALLSFRRRAWQTAALVSLTIAMTHALFDFNFFIPSNPATLAAIAGAAVASVDHDRRTRL